MQCSTLRSVSNDQGLLLLIRKSKDYVYGIWVYKALGIWKGYYRIKKSLVSYMKPWTEARNNKYMKYHSKRTWFIFDRSIDKYAHAQLSMWWNCLWITKLTVRPLKFGIDCVESGAFIFILLWKTISSTLGSKNYTKYKRIYISTKYSIRNVVECVLQECVTARAYVCAPNP